MKLVDPTMIVVHCTATPPGMEVTVKMVDAWHKQRGWKGIGYHYLIYLSGGIHKGRPIDEVGAHVAGYNMKSIGVCYVGGNSKQPYYDTRTDTQKQSLELVINSLLQDYPTIKSIVGHNDLDPSKACPCFDAKSEYAPMLSGKHNPIPAQTDVVLAKGSFGSLVEAWQRDLRDYFYPDIAVDGDFGKETEKYTKWYQKVRGLRIDGEVSTVTHGDMEEVKEFLTNTRG